MDTFVELGAHCSLNINTKLSFFFGFFQPSFHGVILVLIASVPFAF